MENIRFATFGNTHFQSSSQPNILSEFSLWNITIGTPGSSNSFRPTAEFQNFSRTNSFLLFPFYLHCWHGILLQRRASYSVQNKLLEIGFLVVFFLFIVKASMRTIVWNMSKYKKKLYFLTIRFLIASTSTWTTEFLRFTATWITDQ